MFPGHVAYIHHLRGQFVCLYFHFRCKEVPALPHKVPTPALAPPPTKACFFPQAPPPSQNPAPPSGTRWISAGLDLRSGTRALSVESCEHMPAVLQNRNSVTGSRAAVLECGRSRPAPGNPLPGNRGQNLGEERPSVPKRGGDLYQQC